MSQIEKLLNIMAKLRDPKDGCPWDKEQDFATITKHTIEEAYEVVDAVDNNDMELLKSELGDLLLQIVFYAQMAKEQGLFDFEDIVSAINEKMIKRHPHVFGDKKINSAQEQIIQWESQKKEERENKAKGNISILDGIASLPAIMRAQKLQARAASLGFDWQDAEDVYSKIFEEIQEVKEEAKIKKAKLKIIANNKNVDIKQQDVDRQVITDNNDKKLEEELGDLLFSVVNLVRKYGFDSENALRLANNKFSSRFKKLENFFIDSNKKIQDASLAELDAVWDKVKIESK